MSKAVAKAKQQLLHEIEDLQAQLGEAQETLRAIRQGEVDAIVVSGATGEQVFSLVGAESIYRLIVEAMKEAAFTVALDGRILYCNAQFESLIRRPAEQTVGHRLQEFVVPEHRDAAESLLITSRDQPVKQRLVFQNAEGAPVPAHVSSNAINQPDGLSICIVAADLTELENSTAVLEQLRRALGEAEDGRRLLQTLMENVPEGITIADAPGKKIRIESRYGQETLGGTHDGIAAGQVMERWKTFEADTLTPMLDHDLPLARAIERGENVRNLEVVRENAQGRRLTLLCNAAPIRDGAGNITGGILAWRDITVRKRAEEELKQSRARLDWVLEKTGTGMWLHQLPLGPLNWDGQTRRLFFIPAEAEPTAELFWSRIHPDDREPTRLLALKAIRDGTLYQIDYRVVNPETGEIRWIHSTGQATYTADGTPARFDGVNYDITERKQAEILSAAMDSINQIVHSTRDFDEIMRAAIAEAAAALGADSAAVSLRKDGRWSVRYVNNLPSDTVGAVMNDDEERHAVIAIQTRYPVAISDAYNDERANREHLRKWGIRSVLTVPLAIREEVVGVIFFNYRGRTFEFRNSHVDFGAKLGSSISLAIENARLFGDLRQREQSLREASRRKDEFLAMLAHELRNPLAAISNGVELLTRRGAEKPVLEHARSVAVREVAHLARLVDDLLDVSRLTQGRIRLRKETISVASAIEDAIQSIRPLIRTRGHHLLVSLPDEPMLLEADPLRLTQVFANLLDNAARYTPAGGEIGVSAMREGDEAVILVRDNGFGIQPDLVPQIFDAFVQAERSLAREQGGLGIGLTMVRSLVEMHGGRVEAHSDGPGKGTEFAIRLPLLTVPQAQGQGGENPAVEPVVRRRILLVDDNADAAEMMAALLETEGHEVALAHSGTAALDIAVRNPPEIALIDIGMRATDSFELVRRLRKQPALARTLFVALTGYGRGEDLQQAGFAQHLVKPVDLEALRRVLKGEPRRTRHS